MTATASRRGAGLLGAMLVAAFALVVLRTAWVSEDAYISFRTVENLLHGLGPRWNAADRVQAFTHPLWLLAMTGVRAATGEMFYSALFFSAALSVAAVALVAGKLARSGVHALLAVALLTFSKAFVDYSTSGLENPLTHLLLALFLLLLFRETATPAREARRLLPLALLAALLALNRMDLLVLVAPPLAYAAFANRAPLGKKAGVLALGALTLFAWELFAVFYYGFPFPNTAYAKLATGIPRAELLQQGFHYLLNSLSWDPITLFAILGLAGFALATFRERPAAAAVALGILLYLGYVVRIGGDFMSGRFLATPLFCAAVLLARVPLRPVAHGVPLLALFVLLGLQVEVPTVASGDTYATKLMFDSRGIADERGFYYPWTGLLRATRKAELPAWFWVDQGKKAREEGRELLVTPNVGFLGYYAGPGVHIVDTVGLGDPLLARLPTVRATSIAWRIGHFNRPIPEGYLDAVVGKGRLADPALAEYFDRLSLLTRAPLLAPGRLREIWRFNTGGNDRLLAEHAARHRYAAVLVEDQDEALAWYTGKLGFEKRADRLHDDKSRWLTVAPRGSKGFELVLEKERPGFDRRAGHAPVWVFESRDCRRDAAVLRDRGVEFTTEPEDLPWAVRAVFADPWDNRFSLVERRARPARSSAADGG